MPIPRTRYMADDQPTRVESDAPATDAGAAGGAPAFNSVNEVAELVIDLLEPTGLIQLDRLAALRGKVGRGSIAQALRDEGLASDQGVARALADRYHLPY